MWQDISVWQYQQIYKVYNSLDKYTTDADVDSQLIGIVNNMTEAQVDSLPLSEFKKIKGTIAFLKEPITGKTIKFINISYNKAYRVNYDVSKMPFARYIESKVFSEDLYGNLHKLAATMVIPQKRYFGMLFDEPYDASRHQDYANDMLEARFVDVYHSLVFFYQVYRNWIEVSQDFMVSRLTMTGMEVEQAKEVVANLLNILDGSIAPNLLPTMKIAQLRKHMKNQQ